jgi:hypothetical protein
MSKVLVTGLSGTGKSPALAELGRRGYRVVDTDDPGWREYRQYAESSDELHRGEWLWVEEKITDYSPTARLGRRRLVGLTFPLVLTRRLRRDANELGGGRTAHR